MTATKGQAQTPAHGQKLVTLKLSPHLLQSVAQKHAASSTPASPTKSKSTNNYPQSPSKSSQPHTLLDGTLSAGPSSRAASPGASSRVSSGSVLPSSGAGAGTMGTSIAAGGSGGAGSARFTGMMALKGLDRSGNKNPVRRWRKAPIELKSFTGFKYTLVAWNGGPRAGAPPSSASSKPAASGGVSKAAAGTTAGGATKASRSSSASAVPGSSTTAAPSAAETPLSLQPSDSEMSVTVPNSPIMYPSSGASTPQRAATPPLPPLTPSKLSSKPPASINLKNGGSQLAQSPMTMSSALGLDKTE